MGPQPADGPSTKTEAARRAGPSRSLWGGLTLRGRAGTLRDMSPDASTRLAEFIQAEVSKDPRQLVLPQTALISSGLVDSFSLIKVLAFIEDEFGIVIPDEAATAKAMDSIELILKLMETYADHGSGA